MFSITLLAFYLLVGVALGVNVLGGRPTPCSDFTSVDFGDMRKLSGMWVTLESLMFPHGRLIPENHPDDDVQKCKEICLRHSFANATPTSVIVNSEMVLTSRNMTVKYEYGLEAVGGNTSRWRARIKTNETYFKGSEMIVLAGRDTPLVVAICRPDVYGKYETKPPNHVTSRELLLENISIIARRERRRGQNVLTVQEMQTEIDLLKLLGLNKVQWSIPFDTTC